MATCGIIGTIVRDCLSAVGGIKTIYVAEWNRVSSVVQNASGQVTAITMVGGSTFLEYQIEKGVGNLSWPSAISKENGTTVYTQTLTIPINYATNAKDFKLKITGYNRLMIIVLDNNGDYRLMGLTGANMTVGGGTTGTALGDKNGYTLTFVADEPSFPPVIDTSVIAAIVTAAV